MVVVVGFSTEPVCVCVCVCVCVFSSAAGGPLVTESHGPPRGAAE